MKSDKAKVLHEVFYAPMVHHVIKATAPLLAKQTIAIVGHQRQAVEDSLDSFEIDFVEQKEQLGTGHAVLVAEDSVIELTETVMILCGDTPLIQAGTLEDMYTYHRKQSSALTLMTTILDNPTNYGRIICDSGNKVLGIVEQKDATVEQLKIREINAGIYCVDKSFLFSALKGVGTDNSQGEVYLTDIVKIAVELGLNVEKFIAETPIDVLGVNSRVELADAEFELQMRHNKELMMQGISMKNPQTISISPESTIGQDCTLSTGVHISANSQIGQNCRIEQGAILKNCYVGDNCTIGAYSCLTACSIEAGSSLQPLSKNC